MLMKTVDMSRCQKYPAGQQLGALDQMTAYLVPNQAALDANVVRKRRASHTADMALSQSIIWF